MWSKVEGKLWASRYISNHMVGYGQRGQRRKVTSVASLNRYIPSFL